jgi:hypothetical protein
MVGLAFDAKVCRGRDQSLAKMMQPEAIDEDARHQRDAGHSSGVERNSGADRWSEVPARSAGMSSTFWTQHSQFAWLVISSTRLLVIAAREQLL